MSPGQRRKRLVLDAAPRHRAVILRRTIDKRLQLLFLAAPPAANADRVCSTLVALRPEPRLVIVSEQQQGSCTGTNGKHRPRYHRCAT